MSDWIIPTALVLVWATIAGAAWLRVRYVEKRAVRGYVRGFEDGWKQHVAAQLSEDPEFRRAYTEGWLACLSTLDTQTPGWRGRESEYRRWLDDPKFPDFSKVGL